LKANTQSNRCVHGCYIPAGQVSALDLNGTPYCSGCRAMGGAFVLADGHKHVGGCDGVNCDCSFGRAPIYDHRAYRDLGVDQPLPGYFRATAKTISCERAQNLSQAQEVASAPNPFSKLPPRGSECLPTPRPKWTTPSFTVIPRIILDHSQPKAPKPLTNFCPACFVPGDMTKHTEGGFRGPANHREWITTRVFVRTERRHGVHAPQFHDCKEWSAEAAAA
jgi:hypothetical protein